MKTKINYIILAMVAALISLIFTIKYDIWWLAVIVGALIVACAVRSIILSRRADKEAWKKHRFISRTLNEMEKVLFDEIHKELAGIKQDKQPASNVHPGSRVSDRYLAMVQEKEGGANA